MKFLWVSLYKALEKQKPNNISWRHIARKGNFSPSIITRISQGKPISVVNLLKVLQATDFGFVSISPFIKEGK